MKVIQIKAIGIKNDLTQFNQEKKLNSLVCWAKYQQDIWAIPAKEDN